MSSGWKSNRGVGRLKMRGLVIGMALAAVAALVVMVPAAAGGPTEEQSLKVLEPTVRGNLAIFPVVAVRSHDTGELMTLDEGIRSGQVTVTEVGDEEPGLIRNDHVVPQPRRSHAEVNRLVLTNNSKRPLLLLAGEIVTGGKQDRVIGADRIVPPESGEIDMGVFCVEPGRWVASSSNFGSMGVQMAQPSVRTPAMADKDQARVWENVGISNRAMSASMAAAGEAAPAPGTTSYAKVFESPAVAHAVEGYGGREGEQAILRDLRAKGAVGVVVAINGQVVWADVFASTDLLAKYWPKLMHSYIAEAMTTGRNGGTPELKEAEEYMGRLDGGREVAETEPGVFRRTDVTGDGYRVFELTSLLPKTGYVVHLAKMSQ